MEPKSTSRPFFVVAIATIILAIVTISVLEVALHIAALASPQVAAVLFPWQTDATNIIEATVPDAELESRGNPKYPDHDARGFRNAAAAAKADIVAIGDSQTYGTSVESQQAWPRVLGKIKGCQVYNMSLGGYGPLHYAMLAREALKLKPRLLLVGIYFGNDLYDSWAMYLRQPALYPVPNELLKPALDDDRRDPLSRSVTEAFNTVFGLTQTGAVPSQPAGQSADPPVRAFLSGHSAIWGFARAVKRRISEKPPASVLSADFHTAVASLTPQALDYATVFEGEGWRTILTPGYRHAVENEKDSRIQAGFWLTQWAIKDIAEAAAENGAAAIFVLIPTKESVFTGRLAKPPAQESLNQLTAEENRFREKLMNFMDANGLKYMDALPALRSLSQQPYFENIDGHLNAAGQAAIASSLSGLVASCGK